MRTATRGLLVVAALLVTACGALTGTDEAAGPSGTDEAAGPRVPAASFDTFDGGQLSLEELAGAPLVVNFWASWCPPCIAEMPDLERVHADLGDQVRFVGLNTQDDLARAEDLAAQTGVTYQLGLDPEGALFRDFEVVSMPSTFLVDADGVLVHRHAGLLTEPQLRGLLDEHLGVS